MSEGAMGKLMLLKRNSRQTDKYIGELHILWFYLPKDLTFCSTSLIIYTTVSRCTNRKDHLPLPETAFWITFMLYRITNSLAAKTVNISLFQLCINHLPGVLHWIYELLGTGKFYYSILFCSYTVMHVYTKYT